MASTASLPVYMLPGVPVHQPTHLEGDASLATEILPGPPSLAAIQQSAQKRDPRKPSTPLSYLPPSDPGSTYSGIMHGTLIGHDLEGSGSKRSRVDKGTASSRAQRASARSQNGASFTPTIDHPADSEVTIVDGPSLEAESSMLLDEEMPISRSTSMPNVKEGKTGSHVGRPRRRDKGKEKEVDIPVIRVKEEPKFVSLHSPEPSSNILNNEDHCSSCRSQGALVYCDGCPRAFHLWCLNPPVESIDEGDSRWFCPSCIIRKHPPSKPPPSLLSPLIYQLQTSIPVEFQLPEDIRTFFKDVATGPRGAYVDSSEVRQLRPNRHTQLEDRDAYRLKDKHNAPVLCFRCGKSALPEDLTAATSASKRARRSSAKTGTWKSIISCDYCNLHWHLDCLDPPLPSIPPFMKKWMCPNHAEQVLPSKRRIPKQGVPPIDITKPHQFNNGNVEIIHPEATHPLQTTSKIAVDEVLINGRRYRVPERVVILDFWNKLNKVEQPKRATNSDSRMSSPLTSLSSLDDINEQGSGNDFSDQDMAELKAAHLLCSLRRPRVDCIRTRVLVNGTHGAAKADAAIQTESDNLSAATPMMSYNTSAKRTASKAFESKHSQSSVDATSSSHTAKRRKSTHIAPPGPSDRELRSKTKHQDSINAGTSLSRISLRRAEDSSRESIQVDNAMPSVPQSVGGKARPHVKVEETELDNPFNGQEPLDQDSMSTFLPAIKGTPKRSRGGRRPGPRIPIDHRSEDRKERQLRRPKERDTRDSGNNMAEAIDQNDNRDAKERERRKALRTPGRAAATSVSVLVPSSAPATPTLKIRLPRLNSMNFAHANSSTASVTIAGDMSTRS